ncbi:MAG TPA: hypothetical protein VK432_08295 [Stellaceae bacterium]|nr:hypothetical protein [Stellaceae bacterium]
MQLFVDLDGVLADFNRHHRTVFGRVADIAADDVDWDAVRAVSGFYRDIPPMSDMDLLWSRIERLRPIILTGVPRSVPDASEDKQAWVRNHLGNGVEVRCVKSREKCRHAAAGDILIDDWEKYRHLWLAAGGIWITHRSAAETIAAVDGLGL